MVTLTERNIAGSTELVFLVHYPESLHHLTLNSHLLKTWQYKKIIFTLGNI